MELTKIEAIQNQLDFFKSNASAFSNLFVTLKNIHQVLKSDLSIELDNTEKSELFSTIANELLDNSKQTAIATFNELQKNHGRSNQLANFVFDTLAVALTKGKEFSKYEYLDEKTTTRLSNLKSEMDESFDSKSKCYIATMAYGDYNHPQVLELRKFRDDFLSKSRLGIGFIHYYYKHAPYLVSKLRYKPVVNKIIRIALDFLIRLIKHGIK